MSRCATGTQMASEDSRGAAATGGTQLEAARASPGSGKMAALGAADWLTLAAAPTFAIMALLTAVVGGGMPDMPHMASQQALPLNGMALMYVLMSAFHSAPWLKLISRRQGDTRRS